MVWVMDILRARPDGHKTCDHSDHTADGVPVEARWTVHYLTVELCPDAHMEPGTKHYCSDHHLEFMLRLSVTDPHGKYTRIVDTSGPWAVSDDEATDD